MLKKILSGLVILVAVIAVGGWGYQQYAVSSDMKKYPPPGEMVTVDDIALHLDCRGAGKPVVVLESGLGNSSITWHRIVDELATQTQVCMYDRPGMGWSEPASTLSYKADVSARLHALLTAANIEGPYIMGGWSAGGVYIRDYYANHPEDVVGMVFVDSSHEQQGARLPKRGEGGPDRMLELCRVLQPIGLIRASGVLDAMYRENSNVPREITQAMIAVANRSHFCMAVQQESESFSMDIESEPSGSLGDMPLVVLTQGKPYEAVEGGVTEAQFNESRAAWTELQEELTALSSNGRRIVATRTGHGIQMEDPDLVIRAFTDVIAAVRSGEPR